jgi:hypothetical protein
MSEDGTEHAVPVWASRPLHSWVDYTHAELELLRLATTSIAAMQGYGRLAEAMAKSSFAKTEPERVPEAQELSTLATSEVERGFPLLHAHATVALWGSLEVAIDDLVVSWLLNVPGAMSEGKLGQVRLRVAEIEGLDSEALARVVLTQAQGAGGSGSTKLEGVLDLVGLSGEVPEVVRKLLFEMHNVRNLLVHRAGVADARFVAACPWLEKEPGDHISVGAADYDLYYLTGSAYVVTVDGRLDRHFGHEQTDISDFVLRIERRLERRATSIETSGLPQ